MPERPVPFVREGEAPIYPFFKSPPVPGRYIGFLCSSIFPEAEGAVFPGFPDQEKILYFRRNIVRQGFGSIKPYSFRYKNTLAAPYLAGSLATGIIHATVHIEQGLH